jgi:hypothetical protein
MRDASFFQEIEHAQVPWGERSIYVPVFYYDTMRLNTVFLAPQNKLKALLPSARMHPIRVLPGQGIVAISAMAFRDSDLGPYNEVSISIPFTLDRATPLFTGILRKGPEISRIYIRHLPVTTEIARAAGVDFAGYPKFLASIEFEKRDGWISCRLAEGERHILTLSGRELEVQDAPRSRVQYFTARGGRLLCSEGITSERREATSRDAGHARLQLGDHPISQELEELGLGRLLAYQYAPSYQSILSPVLESFEV